MDRASAARLLEQRLNTTWHNHPIAGSNNIRVVDAAVGAWPHARARHGCRSPSLLLFIGGHVRTFSLTVGELRRFAERSAPGCFWAAAVVPDEHDVLPGRSPP
eukprot:4457669-Prymnesium_polylepis.1